ncbi:MAG: GspH/FimT family pseudopilin [Candidatus Eremiobacteraeota bacterium]|nr:GspH/FimT family pseudopilin [Candidatus Eremiobacteraeota bacterium]
MITGILTFIAIGRLNDMGEVNAHGFAEQIASTLRFAQEAAVAQRRLMYVNVNTTTGLVNACLDSASPCAQPLAAPGGNGNLSAQAPTGIALTTTAAQFTFNGLGQPSTSSQVQIQVAAPDGQQFTVTVQPDSGYVQRS